MLQKQILGRQLCEYLHKLVRRKSQRNPFGRLPGFQTPQNLPASTNKTPAAASTQVKTLLSIASVSFLKSCPNWGNLRQIPAILNLASTVPFSISRALEISGPNGSFILLTEKKKTAHL